MTPTLGHWRIQDTIKYASSRKKWALALVAGILTGFALPPFDLWFLALFGFAASLWLFWNSQSARQAALIGWGFGTGYFALSLHWIVEPFLVDAARYLWMAPFALLFLSTGLALFWAAAFWAAHLVARTAGPMRTALAWAICLSIAELLRSYVLTGFPWALISQIWVQTDVIQWIRFIGPHGLTLLTLLAIAAPFATWISKGRIARLMSLFPAVGLVFSALFWGPPETSALPDRPLVRMVQPNAPQNEKWDPEMIPVFFQRQVDFTAAPTKSGARPDLIVWPETAVPVQLQYAESTLAVIADAAQGAPVVLGIQRQDDLRFYNSMILLDTQGQLAGIYDKHHLVPFGEYIPFGSFLGRLGIQGMAAQNGNGFSAGPGPAILDIKGLGRALPLICYEAVFSQDVNRAPERPDFLLQITNDAWFGQFSGPYQHLAQSRMRAIEQGLPMIRAANTGISAMIDTRGQITAQIELGKAGFIDAALPLASPPTIYSRSGDLPITLLLIVSAFGLTLLQMLNRTQK